MVSGRVDKMSYILFAFFMAWMFLLYLFNALI